MTNLFNNPPLPGIWGDAEDIDTRMIADRMQRNQAYENSLFGRIGQWLGSQQERLGETTPGNPIAMALEGAQTANRWMGSPQFPERVQTQDMLAPFGAAAAAAPFMPANTVGSFGGRLRGLFGRGAEEAPTPTAPERPERLLPENFRAEPTAGENPIEFFPKALEESLFVLDSPAYEMTLRSIADSGATKNDVKQIFNAFMGYAPDSSWSREKMIRAMQQRQQNLITSRARSRATAGRIAG